MRNRHYRSALALLAGLALAALTPFMAGTYLVGVALDLLMWIALAESWILLSGMTGYISLGHAVFFGAGSYVMVLCWGMLPFWLVVPLAGLVAGLLALALLPVGARADETEGRWDD